MRTKTAILQVADQGPLESLVVMLRSAGYECYLPGAELRSHLRQFGGLVLSPDDLTRSMGYDLPFPLLNVSVNGLDHCDLFVDVKAHQTYRRFVAAHPRLKDRVLWYRINGGKPEHVVKDGVDHGDEVNPPCPVLTPNQWYKSNNAYTCWPPFARFNEYVGGTTMGLPPICLIHNLEGWGYGRLVGSFAALGVRMFGAGSPHGLLPHRLVPYQLANSLCMVHLKSSDAPGYAIYECLAAGCPLVCTRRLIWRCQMQELLVPGETCLVFDRETHEGLTDDDVAECTREVREHLEHLRDPAENRRIGGAGRKRLQELMWREDRDGDSLREFMRRNFPD